MSNATWLSEYNQTDLFDRTVADKETVPCQAYVVIGQFYEHLTARIFGAEIQGSKVEDSIFPDAVIWNNGRVSKDVLLEVKGSHRQPLLDLWQMCEYRKMKRSTFPYTRPDVYYVLWFYGNQRQVRTGRGIARYGQTVGGIVNYLVEYTWSCVVLDINTIWNLAKASKHYSYESWQGGTRDKYVRWNSSTGELFRYGTKLTANLALCEITDKHYPITVTETKSFDILDTHISPVPLVCIGKTARLRSLLNEESKAV
jgi:hypothetical protein